MALIASRLHLVWIGTVCVRMRTDLSYSNTLGWNTFPVPVLTAQNKTDLIRCAEDILLAREVHFPATIAELYDPVKMPANLREAHERNDETLERIYLGRRFKNDTERLEKLLELYTQMTAMAPAKKAGRKKGGVAERGPASDRSGTPAGVRNRGLLGSGGVASLNHRLQAFIPPGCGCPIPIIPRCRSFPDAGGFTSCSRWLRSNATTPPDHVSQEIRTLTGVPATRRHSIHPTQAAI